MKEKRLIIAIDGFSSCGKSSFAKLLAAQLGYLYIDSGAMYRTVTLYCLRKNLFNGTQVDTVKLIPELEKLDITFVGNLSTGDRETWLNGENVEAQIRKPEIADKVSIVSRIKEVRQRLVTIQRQLGKDKGIVMDGRDIGTVVFPGADLKIFMTANPMIRARRRFLELTEKGTPISYDEVLTNIQQRDELDQNRTESPLKKADDAIVLDNSDMTLGEQMVWVTQIIEKLFREG
jgi:CMP/dCMP kinase